MIYRFTKLLLETTYALLFNLRVFSVDPNRLAQIF